jgi:hypothetical protein
MNFSDDQNWSLIARVLKMSADVAFLGYPGGVGQTGGYAPILLKKAVERAEPN